MYFYFFDYILVDELALGFSLDKELLDYNLLLSDFAYSKILFLNTNSVGYKSGYCSISSYFALWLE
jgi:hypothetical protein